MNEFDSIFLNKTELKLLKKFNAVQKIEINSDFVKNESYSKLLNLGFIKRNVMYDPQTRMDYPLNDSSITKNGRDYLEYYLRKSRHFFIPYVITTLISVFALIKSFLPEIISGMKLLMQLLK